MLAVAVMEVTATMAATTTMAAGIDSTNGSSGSSGRDGSNGSRGSYGSDSKMIKIKIHKSDVSPVLCILPLYPCISINGVTENAGHRTSIHSGCYIDLG